MLAFLAIGESILYATGKKSAMTKNGNKLIGKIVSKIYWPLLISALLVIIVFAVAAYARMVG
ncbi:MAG: hypothetical protein IJZ44_05165 [Lachnospiraceae bacterium]|nr:hypothetical protein [Lachnospiraceae bacterium]